MKQFFFILFFLLGCTALLCAQTADTVTGKRDSLQVKPVADSLDSVKIAAPVAITAPGFTFKNKLLNSDSVPVSLNAEVRKARSQDIDFYLVAAMLLLLAFFKYFYNRYFTNLFRVFFNTSLRQSQLTDQLLQAKLPSLLFNLFFMVSGGMYVYILLHYYGLIGTDNNLALIFSSMALIGLIYFLKFCILKFTGWITGFEEVTNTYVFVIFLINKIIGIFLVPFIIILSFSDAGIVKTTALISLMSIGIFLLLRFFRSYGLVQNQLKINRFHFVLYITGIEILPLLLIYKGLMLFLSKNL